jgi:hypothetical protein
MLENAHIRSASAALMRALAGIIPSSVANMRIIGRPDRFQCGKQIASKNGKRKFIDPGAACRVLVVS